MKINCHGSRQIGNMPIEIRRVSSAIFVTWMIVFMHQQTYALAQADPGCAAFATGSRTRCTRCRTPAYRLSGAQCICSTGYNRIGGVCVKRGPCFNKCGQISLQVAGTTCSCDYFCDNVGDCCGGTASKNQMCPALRPTLNRQLLTDCNATAASIQPGNRPIILPLQSPSTYKPGMCWCDSACLDNNDCCPLCTEACRRKATENVVVNATAAAAQDTTTTVTAAVTGADAIVQPPTAGAGGGLAAAGAGDAASAGVAAAAAAAATAAAVAAEAHRHGSDCGGVDTALTGLSGDVTASAATIAAVARSRFEAETLLQACQAIDAGPPAEPLVVQLFWTAGQVCNVDPSTNSTVCEGGDYGADLVAQQVAFLNSMWRRSGIQFKWDGNITFARARDNSEIYAATSLTCSYGECWVCKMARRFGDFTTIHVMTAPRHLGQDGMTLGVTQTPELIATGYMPVCADWVFIYEKTLPNQGARSKVDGQLVDSGHVLAHEVGHALGLLHTWNDGRTPGNTIAAQCDSSASLAVSDITDRLSDGVRDTPAQSLNGSFNSVTPILRFINCDPATGAYTNTTAFAQRSCTSDRGFSYGDAYLNNINNLMSYGDKSCLRTLTPGQGARASLRAQVFAA